jgi:hypothetical protein
MLILISRAPSTLMKSVEVNWLPWTPFCVSSGRCWWSVDLVLSGADYAEDFAGDVTLEHPNGNELDTRKNLPVSAAV